MCRNILKITILLLSSLLLLLCACTQAVHNNPNKTDNTDLPINTTVFPHTANELNETPSSQELTSTAPIVSITYAPYGITEHLKLNGVSYSIRSNDPVEIRTQETLTRSIWTVWRIQVDSMLNELIIPFELEQYGNILYVATHDLHFNHVKKITFSEGIEGIDMSESTIYADNVEEIYLPSTLTALVGANLPLVPGYNDFSIIDNATSMIMHNTFPSWEFPALQQIHVAPNNPLFDDEDGILYQWQHLVCIPQDYQVENSTVIIREGTADIRHKAIYQCRNIKRLIVPDSVVDLHYHAIIATAEHPLTVVCSRDSAAAAYVEEFGEQYHLTVEYAD